MILFFLKKTGEVIGTIEGRVFNKEQLAIDIIPGGVDPKDVGKIIIGQEEIDDGLPVEHPDKKETKHKDHNPHLWQDELDFEDPKNPKHPLDFKIKLGLSGKPSLEKKPKKTVKI